MNLDFLRRCVSLVLLLRSVAAAQPASVPGGDLTNLSLEELMNVVVTSVSKKAQPLSKTPAAAFVLTQEDIRRSGMTNIPDLLRLVPGVNVARISANAWAISVRGFNDRYSTKVLVMIDGRTVYSTEFSGVYWDQISVPLEDIERIEVIRGPGGTIWGANAVNGVINIITKHTSETRGGLASVGGGSEDSAQAHVRYGGSLGRHGDYRVYGRFFNVDNAVRRDGTTGPDGWDGRQAGFRSDLVLSDRDTVTVGADLYSSRQGQSLTTVLPDQGFVTRTFDDAVEAQVTSLMGRWKHVHKSGAETTLQVFYTDFARVDQGDDDYDAYDAEFQHRFRAGRHDIVAGAGYRHSSVLYEPFYNFRYDENYLVGHLANVFLQDEIALSENLSLTAGSKFEYNNLTGFEFEPSAQLRYSRSESNSVWFSVARAIRQPSFIYYAAIVDAGTFSLPDGSLAVSRFRGSRDSQTERLLNFEAGYRTAIGKSINLDLVAFRSHYESLATAEAGDLYFDPDPVTPHFVYPVTAGNKARARNYGAEILATWQATSVWRLNASYSYLQMKTRPHADGRDANVVDWAGNSPKHQWQLRSALKLARNVDWDAGAYYVGELRTNLGGVRDFVSAYVRVDTRFGWRFHERAEFSVTGQNLLAPRHLEFPSVYLVNPTQVQRAVFGKLAWTF